MNRILHAIAGCTGAIGLALAIGLSTPAFAEDLPTIKMHNETAATLLNDALLDQYWTDAWKKDYQKELYDEVRLKSVDSGYVPMISGEGETDFDRDVVADIVFQRMTRLPQHMEGAKAVVSLGSGFDPKVGAEYEDTFYFVDLTLFYTTFTQRTYRLEDAENNTTYLFFERVDATMVDTATWDAYTKKMDDAAEAVDRRWAFSSIVPATDVYGLYIVSPGDSRKTRVTLISKLVFGADAGWVARWGSQMPSVIKAGIKSGFNACVAIADEEQKKRG